MMGGDVVADGRCLSCFSMVYLSKGRANEEEQNWNGSIGISSRSARGDELLTLSA
jgi:hypothetical protein